MEASHKYHDASVTARGRPSYLDGRTNEWKSRQSPFQCTYPHPLSAARRISFRSMTTGLLQRTRTACVPRTAYRRWYPPSCQGHIYASDGVVRRVLPNEARVLWEFGARFAQVGILLTAISI